MEMGKAPVTKTLVMTPSGNLAESVYFERPEKQVICISTQLNCAVGCTFCASPADGYSTINLSTEDMISQVDEMGGHTDKVMLYSFMGEGEPFLNFHNVVDAMHILEKRDNCKISVSTSGYKIRLFALQRFEVPVKLQVSVHSADDATRKSIIPNAMTNIQTLVEDINFWHAHTDNPIELNFALIDGVNDSDADMQLIKDTFPDEHIKISKLNPVEGSGLVGSKRIKECLAVLDGMDYEYHETDGSEVGAACGQTRGQH